MIPLFGETPVLAALLSLILSSFGAFPVADAPRIQDDPAIAYDGQVYWVVWRDTREGAGSYAVYGARVDASGKLLDPGGVRLAAGDGVRGNPAIAAASGQGLAVWRDRRSGRDYDIYGARVDSSGRVLDPGGFPIAAGPGDQVKPAVAFDGADYLVVWVDHRGGPGTLAWTRVSSSATLITRGAVPLSAGSENPGLACVTAGCLVVWEQEETDGDRNLMAHLLSRQGGAIREGIVVSAAPRPQLAPKVASDGDGFLVVWEDRRGPKGIPQIYAAGVSREGEVLDPEGNAVAPEAAHQTFPSVLFGLGTYQVVWSEGDERSNPWVRWTRVAGPGGAPRRPAAGVAPGTHPQVTPVIAQGGTRLLAVWTEYAHSVCCDLYGALLDIQAAGGHDPEP